MYFIRVLFVALLAFVIVESSRTSCYGDENAYLSDCSNQCVNNCNQEQVCTMACEKGCSCKTNYVFDGAIGRCVLRKNCSNRRGHY